MIGLYARVSTQEQAKEGYSIDEQIDRLKKFCEAHGKSDFKVFVDPGHSGADMERPALQEIIKGVKDGEIEKVIVYKLDRLSRSQKDTLFLIEDVFLKNGVDFESMSEKFDTGTSFGRAMVGILAVFAQLEREQIKERMSIGKEGRAKKGKWHGGGWSPVGYDYKDGKLQINEYEAMQIREVFSLYLQGNSFAQIDGIFNNKGYKHKYGEWSSKRVREVILNPIYIGDIKHEDQTYKGIHDPIIERATYEKAQAIYEERYKAYQGQNRSTRQSSYLGGMLQCKQCTAKYGLHIAKSNDVTYKYYSCYSRRKINRKMIKDPNCKNKRYNMKVLDNIVLAEIKKLATDPNYVVEIREEKNNLLDESEKVKLIQEEIKKLDAQRSRFMDLYGIGDFTSEELQEKINPLKEQKKRLQAEIEALTGSEPELSVEDVEKIVENFEDILDRGVFSEIRLVVESLIQYIEIDGEEIIIHWKFA